MYIPLSVASKMRQFSLAKAGFSKNMLDYYKGYPGLKNDTLVVFMCRNCGEISAPNGEDFTVATCTCGDMTNPVVCSQAILNLYFENKLHESLRANGRDLKIHEWLTMINRLMTDPLYHIV